MVVYHRSYNKLRQDNFPKETNEVLRNTDGVKEVMSERWNRQDMPPCCYAAFSEVLLNILF